MKKIFIRVLMPLFLILCLSAPVFAEESRYVPEVPPFYSGGKITTPYNKEANLTVSTYFKDFDSLPHVVLVSQDTSNGYVDGTFVGADRRWKLIFVKLRSSYQGTSFGDFVYYDPLKYANFEPTPMQLASNTITYYDTATYEYNFEKKTLDYLYCSRVNKVQFSYVLESSPLSNTASTYPGYRTLAGKYNFNVQAANPRDMDRHYDWWLGYKEGGYNPEEPGGNEDPDLNMDTDGDGKPDLNVDTNGDGKSDLNVDTNGDGKPDLNVDTNGDGKPDLNVDTNGDGKPDLNVDTNGDRKPDLNVDTNGDRKPNVNVDTNGDGKPDTNIDVNGDNRPDVNIDTNGDGKPEVNVDTDGDGKPDINIDADDDNKPDVNVDTDGDGKPDQNIQPDYDWKPGTGQGSGGGSGGSGGGTDSGSDWDDWFWPEDDGDYPYDDFEVFNPFDYDNFTPPTYNNPYTDYNPMEGYDPAPVMPDFPPCPTVPDYGYDPFKYPY